MEENYVMNKEGKYGYLFVQDLSGAPEDKTNPEAMARYRTFGERQLWIDGNCVPGSFQMNTCFWMKPNAEMIKASPNSQVAQPHHHPYPEILGFVGTDPENPLELGGVVEFWVDGECHRLTKSTMVFLPPNLPHCPLMTIEQGDKPILHFSVVMNETYGYERGDQPKE
ncbi:MAG: hypothetical protein MJ092_05050 [Lachnospiraceae bacterium]|nr:hypothetical protein [Lachnospiraceae bacterium]